jgi:2,3-bisphosphoglycerate-dependent phosphoglycerate mutase
VRLIFARHGESEYSALSLLNGDPTVPCGLTARGVEQARALGEALADEPLELCATSGFQRVEETADEALRGRDVPRLVVPGLADPRYGRYEGSTLAEFRVWASEASSAERPGPGGESRLEIVERYARSFRLLLARPEELILVVAHSLPIAYVLAARDGVPPGTNVPIVEHAKPYPFEGGELERATAFLERWTAAPTW